MDLNDLDKKNKEAVRELDEDLSNNIANQIEV